MNLQQLYESDFSAWALHNAALLKTGQLEQADVLHISEELESMAKKDRNELISRLIILLAHLLKWEFQFHTLSGLWREFNGKSWQCSIAEQRLQIQRQLKLSPSLKAFLPDAIHEAYPDAVKLAARETGLPLTHFPVHCGYHADQLLDDDFFPANPD